MGREVVGNREPSYITGGPLLQERMDGGARRFFGALALLLAAVGLYG